MGESTILRLPSGQVVTIDVSTDVADLERLLGSESLIIEGSYGFNLLGGFLHAIADTLGVSQAEVRHHCDWNTNHNDKLSLVVVQSQLPASQLKAVVCVPTQLGRVYERYATTLYGRRPYRNFYYSIVFEALTCLSKLCKPCSVAIARLTGNQYHHRDITCCIVDAFLDYCSGGDNRLQQISFVGYQPSEVAKSIEIVAGEARHGHRYVETTENVVSSCLRIVDLDGWDIRD